MNGRCGYLLLSYRISAQIDLSTFLRAHCLLLQVLTPLQRARTAIECYPHHPDVFSIVDCIAMQARSPRRLSPPSQ